MKLIKCILVAMTLMVLIPQQTKAKQILVPKGYMFGFIANFTDSVVYLTDIQTMFKLFSPRLLNLELFFLLQVR